MRKADVQTQTLCLVNVLKQFALTRRGDLRRRETDLQPAVKMEQIKC